LANSPALFAKWGWKRVGERGVDFDIMKEHQGDLDKGPWLFLRGDLLMLGYICGRSVDFVVDFD